MDKFKSVFKSATDTATEAATAVSEKVDSVTDSAKETEAFKAMDSAIESIKDTEAYQQIQAFKEEKLKELQEFENEQKRKLAQVIYEKLDGVFEHSMTVVNAKTKQSIYDPYMPKCVRKMTNDLIDAWWPDVKNEVKTMILSGIAPKDLYHGEEPCCKYTPMVLFRYWMQPYDRNIWRKIRNPFWWFFTLLTLVPRYGIASMTFTIYFLMIDRSDEYQLQEFILSFKALQFLSLGIASCIYGCMAYFFCTTSTDYENRGENVCEEWAPREQLFTVALFVWQVILVWIAFILLRWAKPKGGEFYHLKKLEVDPMEDGELTLEEALVHDQFLGANAEADEEGSRAAKRRLRNFLIYDFIIFLICAACTAWLAFHFQMDPSASVHRHDSGGEEDNWKFASGLYWLKVFYGTMSFPFMLLKMPGLSTLISHAKPTGYNPYGNTVKYLGKEEDGPLPWDPERPTTEEREAAEKAERKKRKAEERAARGEDDSTFRLPFGSGE